MVVAGKLGPMKLSARQAHALARIQKELASVGPCVPGSLVVRLFPCGKPNCACHSQPPKLHGPYRSWTRKVGGKTVTRLLSEDQLADYQALFDNHRRMRALLAELEEIGLALVESDLRWPDRA
jgi:hypothetical protein